ncbi:trimeric autotransporter adhesin Knh [Kingella kingae]|uniref:trimeric autotransporter adhesin Knh n=3 Tax=Kingella kingae TaxID=504 RepID=UPI00254F0611|nr:trimeric autotransporter adhesin Knh [Kingella kingae]MDK4545120.1 trimeric autotransporter adhesin Knh [Kingella kingae]MDK4567166.1 trimeric autotransporter adhesin Knh [Kingella kingae]MDK4589824.1 trimeric autotransporter adhesin Knh [Kingella kingae]MDK4628944.1 trimeric autotransporter adhesin Knh [Kingella kingae]MDK4636800.1 trimeric autotransporter adhesin Knh [Kingella kingae]
MNHTYRVVYNESTNTYVAVAEFEPSKGKSKSSKKAVAVAVALAAAQLVPLTAQAAVSIGSTSGTSITAEATVTGEGNGVAVGGQAKANYSAVAVGHGASATGTDVAVGPNANATGSDNIAIGNNSKASSADPKLNYGIIAIGNQSIGSASEVVAIGQLACATASQAVALGAQAKATGEQSVALGGNTLSSGAAALAFGGDDLDKASSVGRSTNGEPNTTGKVINEGDVNKEFKKISGQDLVKKTDKSTSTNNTDAQYMATNAYGAASIAVGIQSRSGDLATAFGTQSFATGLASTALGVASNASGDGSIAVGPGTDATGKQSIGMGANASSSNNHSIAIGTNATASGNQSISIGYTNNVSGNNSGAFGDLSKITGSGAYTVGNNNTMAANEAGAFGNLNNFTSAANYSRAVGNNVTVSGSNTMVLGNDVNATTNGSVVLGNSSSGSMSVVTCSSATVNGITYGNFTGNVTGTGKYVSVGANAADARKIVNVAAGNISATSTEAINGSQLYLTQDIIANVANSTAKALSPNSTYGANGSIKPNITVNNGSSNVAGITNVEEAIKKAGWQLKANGSRVDDINAGDVVNFASNDGTVKVKGTAGSTIDLSVNTTTLSTNVNGTINGSTAPTNLVNASTVADAINKSGWKTIVDGKTEVINPGDTVNYVSGSGTTANVTKGTDGAVNVSYDVNITTVSTTPVTKAAENTVSVLTGGTAVAPKNTTKAGGFLTAAETVNLVNSVGFNVKTAKTGTGTNAKADGTTLVKAGNTVTLTAGDNINIDKNGTNFTISAKSTVTRLENGTTTTVINTTNAAGNPTYKVEVATTPLTVDMANGTVTAPNTTNAGKIATAGDVANAINQSGWKTKNSNGSVSVINPGDAVNYENGTGTTVNVVTNAKTRVTTVKYNVNTATFNSTATTPQANAVTINAAGQAVAPNTNTQAAKDSFITAADTVNLVNNISHNITIGRDDAAFTDQAGKAPSKVKAGDTIALNAGKNLIAKQNGNNITFATAENVTFNNVNTTTMTVGSKPDNAVNFKAEKATPANNNSKTNAPTTALNITSADGKPTQITGVASGLNTTTVAINPDSNAATKEQPATLVDLANASNVNAAATVGDLKNMGWVVSTKDGNGYVDVVKNANQVDFKGTGLATVKGETVNGVRTITVDVNAQSTVENAQLPIVYTNENGDKLVKGQNGKFYKPADIANATYNPTTKTYTNTAGVTVAPATTVIASMNNGDNNTTAPMTLTNVKGTLESTTSVANADGKGNAATGIGAEVTKAKAAPTLTAVQLNNAATVGDVLNAGWNLQGNGQAVDFVRPYDTVNFVNGAGTTATVTSDGNASKVAYNIAVDNKTTQIVDGKGNPLVQAANGNYYLAGTKMDSTGNPVDTATPAVKPAGTQVAAKTTDLTVNNGKVDAPTNGDSLVNATTVANAINNSGFTLKAQGENASVVNPGETVNMKNTDGNIVISKDAANNDVVYDLAKNITVDSVTAGNTTVNNAGITIKNTDPNKTVSLTDGGLNNGGNTITNVAAGVNDTDAVNVSQLKSNVSQLKSQVAASKEEVTSNDKTVRVNVSTNATTGANIYDVSVNTGKSLTINSTTGAIDVKTDDTTIKQGLTGALEVVTTNLTVANNGKVDTPTNGSSLVNATMVANAINNSGWNLQANGDTASKVSPGNTVQFLNGGNIDIKRDGNNITVATSKNINVAGDLTVAGNTIVKNFTVNPNSTVNMGGNKVQGVAAGVISANSTDAINGSQLYYTNQAIGANINNVANNLNARINDVADDADAGTASAMATAGVPQAYLPGKSMVAVGASTYRGKQGYAVGFSAISDSGNWIVKGTASGNSRGHFGATVGAGYQW